MRLKSYFAASVGSALVLARCDLGDEALLVHSRLAPVEVRHLGRYEVVVALLEDAARHRFDSPVTAGHPDE